MTLYKPVHIIQTEFLFWFGTNGNLVNLIAVSKKFPKYLTQTRSVYGIYFFYNNTQLKF